MVAPKTSVLKSAEDIFSKMMSGEEPNKSKSSTNSIGTPASTTILDIRKVPISNSFIDSILESSFNSPTKVEEVVEEEKIQESETKDKLTDLVSRLAALIKEAKNVLQEMTTTGMLGTNQKFLLLDKKKNGTNKSNKRK